MFSNLESFSITNIKANVMVKFITKEFVASNIHTERFFCFLDSKIFSNSLNRLFVRELLLSFHKNKL